MDMACTFFFFWYPFSGCKKVHQQDINTQCVLFGQYFEFWTLEEAVVGGRWKPHPKWHAVPIGRPAVRSQGCVGCMSSLSPQHETKSTSAPKRSMA